MPLCNRTAVLIGPLLGSLSKDALQGGLGVFSEVIGQVDPDKVDQLFMDALFAAKITCDNNPICNQVSFEKHFDQYRGDVYQVCVWGLWECVKDFFPNLGTFTQTIANKMKEPESKSQPIGQ